MRRVRKVIKKMTSALGITKVTQVNMPLVEEKLLKDRIALITGGSGGIGAAIAERFAKCGCYCILTGTNRERLENECKKIGEDRAKYVVWNLEKFEEYDKKIIEIIDIARSWNGQISILINNAGVHGNTDFWNTSFEDWDNIMNVNLKTVYFLTKTLANYMKENKIEGNILNISSASALKPAWTPYEISKWGIRGMTLGLAQECIKYNIIVNAIGPGPTKTKMISSEMDDNIEWRYNPSERMATPQEIANWAVYMVSNIGRYIVGDTLYITGGSGTIDIGK